MHPCLPVTTCVVEHAYIYIYFGCKIKLYRCEILYTHIYILATTM